MGSASFGTRDGENIRLVIYCFNDNSIVLGNRSAVEKEGARICRNENIGGGHVRWNVSSEFAGGTGYGWSGSLLLIVLIDGPFEIACNGVPANSRSVRECQVSIGTDDSTLTNVIFDTSTVSEEMWSTAHVAQEGGNSG